jgi:hypothetical protein
MTNPSSQPLYELLRAEAQLAKGDRTNLEARLTSFRDFCNVISLQMWDLFRICECACQCIANTEDALKLLDR